MRPPLFACLFALLAASGCTFEPFDLVDSTEGDEGRSHWSLDDGLCPGFGHCEMAVPVATGATIGLQVDLPDRLVSELTPIVVEGDAIVIGVHRDPEAEVIFFDVSAEGAGTIELAVVDPDGETIDRSRLDVRDPVALDCGTILPSTAVGYEMAALLPDAHDVTMRPSDGSESAPQLACLVTDAEGEALVSADLVHWSVGESETSLVTVRSNPFDFLADDEADGARVWVERVDVETVGSATLTASLGEASETFTVTIE